MTVWNINITAPTGGFDATLHIEDASANPSGEMSSKKSKGPMQDLKLDASSISWSTKIERPMPMTLKFKGEHDGTGMTGTVKFGMFASGTFSGTRV